MTADNHEGMTRGHACGEGEIRSRFARTLLRLALTSLSLATLVMSCPVAGRAQQRCAWLNAATAGGFLGGSVTATVTATGKNSDDSTCEFVLRDKKLVSMLRIEVKTVSEAHDTFMSETSHCGAQPAPLRAIGNEATICSRKGKNHQTTERVVARVRDRIFVIDISSNSRPVDHTALRDKAEKISEQVAGILF